eukprot:CAMPEP_0172178276 /NCGR_PEP_ID=MMETSP1050-20130122/15933_1 /TAXON_ID=233186 /ORGANISM="Cryptomonas curvata, Strain CCAP979/52" /LENGTH=382 /DNA_ID=CAMNT_0012850951 /DNA_START=80 /DNA_END=1225 /DNA_ORIENTATION=+
MVKAVRSFSWPACFELFSSPLKRLVERNGTKGSQPNSRNRHVLTSNTVEHTTESGLDYSSLEKRNAQHDEINSILDQLSGDNDLISAIAAIRLFEKVHAVNPHHAENKAQMLLCGVVPVLASLVNLETPDRVRHHVCCVLSELAFQDATCCFTIVNQPGLLDDLTLLLDPAAGQTQEDAARIVNNLAAFCEHSVPILVKCPGLLLSLAAMAARDLDARHIAIGALNSLSRCGLSRPAVAVEPVLCALAHALEDPGESERHAATRASAAMALANLTGDAEPLDAHRLCRAPGNRFREAVEGIVVLFELSVLRRQRGGILFRPYSVLYPLHQLCRHPPNRALLVAMGLLPRLRLFFAAEAAGGPAAAAERDAVRGRSLVLAIAI